MQTATCLVPAAARPASPSLTFESRALECPGMRVLRRDLAQGTEWVSAAQHIELHLPMEATRLRASLHDRQGRRVEAVLAAPDAALVPAGARALMRAEQGGAVVSFSLEPARCGEVARAWLGHEREIREPWVGCDGFARGVAEIVHGRPMPDRAWLEAIAQDVMVHLATRYGRPSEAPIYGGLAPHRLERVLAIIEERLAEPIQVHELAAAVNMSPYHFARMFKLSTGQPPHLYITWQRMDRAKELLARSSLTLAQVAARVGYQTQAHFTGVFHGRVGATPRAYRLRCANTIAARTRAAEHSAGQATMA